MNQTDFDSYLLNKYGDYETAYGGIHHYETTEVRNSKGVVIVPAGLQVEENYSVNYYDYFASSYDIRPNITVPVTNYEYEERIEDAKRNIFLLKPRYLNVVFDDLDEIMSYKKGSTQYVSETLKRGDNIRLYQ